VINLPSISEQTLKVTLQGPWGSDVVLIGPDGKKYPHRGQLTIKDHKVGSDSRGIAHGGRNTMVVYRAVIALRRSQVDPIPNLENEEWACLIPVERGGEPEQVMYLEQAPDGDQTHGFIIFRLTKVKQIP
jgi:hypothetical protein